MTTPAPSHIPVLLAPIRAAAQGARRVVDATLGHGGHAEMFLGLGAEVLGIDRDPEALAIARERLGAGVQILEAPYASDEGLAAVQAFDPDFILLDLGVSSRQLDDDTRGFTFRPGAALDMRMGPESTTAAELVNTLGERELATILREYGEEPMARGIARAIVNGRAEGPIETTARLAEIVRSVKKPRFREIDPSTLTFQALRIAANEELVGLDKFVDDAVNVLEKGARIAIIAFHSLEDRIVKRALRRLEGECTCPPNLPVCGCGAKEVVKILTSRPVIASEEEIGRNPRSRSAKLRVGEKLLAVSS